jgi:hypothetical protein
MVQQVRLQLQDTYEQIWSHFVKVTRHAINDQMVKTTKIIKMNHKNSSLIDSQHKLVRPSDLCESANKLVHQSPIATDRVQQIVN